MSQAARITTWSSGQILTASALNGEFNNLVTFVNNADSGASNWGTVSAVNASTVPLIADNSTGTNDIAVFRTNGSNVLRVTNTGILTPNVDVNGPINLRDSNTKSRNNGLVSETNAALVSFGINDGTSNRFGGSYTQADQGGLIRMDTRSGQSLFQIMGRAAAAASDVSTLVSVTSAGIVSAALNPSSSAYNNTTQTITTSTFTALAFNTKRYDAGTNYSTGTNTFTAPVAGRYLVIVRVVMNKMFADQFYELGIAKNIGSDFTSSLSTYQNYWYKTQTVNNSAQVMEVINLAANDTLNAVMIHNLGSDLVLQAETISTVSGLNGFTVTKLN